MDFLKIRKKARERARADGAAGPGPTPIAVPPAPPTAGEARPEIPADLAAEIDAGRGAAEELEGALAARLEGPPALEEGFTTWRPGAGPPPQLADPQPIPGDVPVPRSEDFALVTRAATPGAALLAPAPLAHAPVAEAAPPAATAAATPPAAAERPGPRAPLDEFFYRPDEETPELPAIGGRVEPAPEADLDSVVREEYLTFLLGREEYAVAIERVREVVKAPPITEVPRAPAHVLGVVTVRGEVVAVLDPRRRLGLPGAAPTDGAGRVVIVDAGEGACGLVVDAVASVVRLPPGAIEPCPQGIGGPRAEFLAGIGRDGDRLFTVLDLGALLRRAPPPGRRRDEEGLRAGP
jgi:purine-binding chemotaxis protein CheW